MSRLRAPGLRPLLPLVAAGAALMYLRGVYRFRDPVRVPQEGGAAGVALSPADGVVGVVRRVTGGQVTGAQPSQPLPLSDLLGLPVPPQEGWLLGVLVGPLDVHFTYHPTAGTVAGVQHSGSRQNLPLWSAAGAAALLSGRPLDPLGVRATLENERHATRVQTDHGEVIVTLVAPGSGLNATGYVREGDLARAGNKTAFLDEGGLVLLFLPAAFTPQVSVGDRVVGAETVVGRVIS